MTRSFLLSGTLALSGLVSCAASFAQSSASPQSPSQAPAASPTSAPAQSATSGATTDTKKTKKVWTNDDVNGLSGPVSVVGNSKNLGKAGGASTKADPQYIASTRKELAKLQSQLNDADKQLADLTSFSEGKAPATSSGYQINKGYNREPVDQQITGLQAKKKELQGKIDALLDEARKKGVEPGDLR